MVCPANLRYIRFWDISNGVSIMQSNSLLGLWSFALRRCVQDCVQPILDQDSAGQDGCRLDTGVRRQSTWETAVVRIKS